MKRLHLNRLLLFTFAVVGMLKQTAFALIAIDTVPVGNAGNGTDDGSYYGYGAVGYNYGIGKYEVTLNQYTAFLNAVAKTDTYGLYSLAMATDVNVRGISRGGAAGSYTYSVIGNGNRPVTYVSWFDAARFVNWLHNGQPIGAQSVATTESGAYTLNGAVSGIVTRNANWIYGLPTEDEWVKAAYHQPAAQGGDVDDYWLYPTASNTMPNSRNGSGSDANSGNFFRDDGIANGFNGGYAVSQSTAYPPTGNVLTSVGAFTLARSFYGTFDQGGNVMEWNDLVNEGTGRGIRGGAWGYEAQAMQTPFRGQNVPESEFNVLGFRVVVVPEPSAVAFAGLGATLFVWARRKSAV